MLVLLGPHLYHFLYTLQGSLVIATEEANLMNYKFHV